jgi:aminopeptidase N
VWYGRNTGLDVVARETAKNSAAALATYNQRFGPYPYRTLKTHFIRSSSRTDFGLEYPGLIFIYTNGTYSTDTRYTAYHEIAHQWFYGILGNDVLNEPWMDESFAQYAPLLAEAAWADQAAADTYYQQEILRFSQWASQPVGLSVGEYNTWSAYYYSVYARGAHFLHTLRGRIGDAAFFKGMQQYYAQQKYGIVHKNDFKLTMECSSGQNLDAFFQQWLGR